jgi:hypothetical protein
MPFSDKRARGSAHRLQVTENRKQRMRKLREIARCIGWSFLAATLIFCLGSLQVLNF